MGTGQPHIPHFPQMKASASHPSPQKENQTVLPTAREEEQVPVVSAALWGAQACALAGGPVHAPRALQRAPLTLTCLPVCAAALRAGAALCVRPRDRSAQGPGGGSGGGGQTARAGAAPSSAELWCPGCGQVGALTGGQCHWTRGPGRAAAVQGAPAWCAPVSSSVPFREACAPVQHTHEDGKDRVSHTSVLPSRAPW